MIAGLSWENTQVYNISRTGASEHRWVTARRVLKQVQTINATIMAIGWQQYAAKTGIARYFRPIKGLEVGQFDFVDLSSFQY